MQAQAFEQAEEEVTVSSAGWHKIAAVCIGLLVGALEEHFVFAKLWGNTPHPADSFAMWSNHFGCIILDIAVPVVLALSLWAKLAWDGYSKARLLTLLFLAAAMVAEVGTFLTE